MSIRFVPAVLVAAIVALVVVGGAALAFGRGSSEDERTDDLLDRAATELGVDAQTLKDALDQAQSDIAAERQREILEDLVEAEVISREQADEAAAWLDDKPAAVDDLMRPDVLIRLVTSHSSVIVGSDLDLSIHPVFNDEIIERMAEALGIESSELRDALENGREGQLEDRRDKIIDDLIAQLVEDGEITEAEGAEMKAWLDDMPDWLDDHRLLFRIFAHGFSTITIEGAPFFHDFGNGNSLRILPELEGLRREHERFFMPNPPFELFGDELNGHHEHFFYRGPEGEFHFDGEVPEEFEGLFDGLHERFGGEFRFEGLEGLFEEFPRFYIPDGDMMPDYEDDDSDDDAEDVRSA